LASGLPKYIETFKMQFEQMRGALEAAQSDEDKEFVKGQMNELYKLIEMHVQSLRNIQKSMKEFAATEKAPPAPPAAEETPRPEMDEETKGRLASFMKKVNISETDLQTLRQRGWDQITAGDWDAAISTLTQATGLAPQDVRSLVLLGWAYSGKDMYEKAEGFHERALEKEPDNAMALTDLGYMSLKRCNYREAIEFLSRVIKQDSDRTATIYANCYMGLLYLERQMMTDAVMFLKKAIELSPNLAEAHYYMGIAHKRMGDIVEAKKSWQEAMDLGPESRWAELAKEETESAENVKLRLKTVKPGEFSP
jgi:tetratricopeptide (TPR) repeat protein